MPVFLWWFVCILGGQNLWHITPGSLPHITGVSVRSEASSLGWQALPVCYSREVLALTFAIRCYTGPAHIPETCNTAVVWSTLVWGCREYTYVSKTPILPTMHIGILWRIWSGFSMGISCHKGRPLHASSNMCVVSVQPC